MAELNITAVLLEKYHSGLCSPAEVAAVEAWLTDSDEDPIKGDLLDADEETEIEDTLWSAIAQSTIVPTQRKQRNYRTLQLLGYGIAASLFFALCCLNYRSMHSGKVEPENVFVKVHHRDGMFKAESSVNGLHFTAYELSSLSGGAMVVRNTSGKDISLQFLNSDQSGQGRSTALNQRNFICKKGITYVALHPDKNSEELILVDMRYMEDVLPLHLAMKLNRELKFI